VITLRLVGAALGLGSGFFAATASGANPALPVIPSQTFYITNYGAVGDGVATNTVAIQNALNAAANSALHGGTVEITAGTFLSGPLTLASGINLRLDAGAVLRMLPYGQYPGGIVSPPNFINGSSLHDVEISGPGAIDGQGLPWWQIAGTNSSANRPAMVNLSACTRVLIQEATFSNSPSPHLVVKGRAGNVTIQGVTIRAPSSHDPVNPSHNTDAIDLAETNCVIRDCDISVGDDNVAIGSSASASADILVTNCVFGEGHGVSIGSYTSGGVSNLTVIDCTFTNTDQGIRLKSDRDRGGLVRNLGYYNLGMGNVMYPILIYCSYTNTVSTFRLLNNVTPAIAATYPSNAVTSKTPIYRDIVISNVTGSAQSGRRAGLIWGLPEMSLSNLSLARVNLTGSKPFGIYYAQNVELRDARLSTPSNVTNVSFYNARLTFTNSAPDTNALVLDGFTTNGIGNALALFNTTASLQNTNALASSPGVTLGASTLAIGNYLALAPASVLNFALGTQPATVTVSKGLRVDGEINVSAGAGFGPGAYTLFTYGSGLAWGAPSLGSVPAGFSCSLDTNTVGQVRLVVQRQPSLTPVKLGLQAEPDQLRLTWPADHIGWRLQMQTNADRLGLTGNWFDVAGAAETNLVYIPLVETFGSVFLRLVYP